MTQIPSKTDILAFIADNPTQTAKRDIARAFGIKGADRIMLKQLLREMEAEGKLTKRRSSYRDAEKLPPVQVLEIRATSRSAKRTLPFNFRWHLRFVGSPSWWCE